jgi:hypothetical protein
VRKQSSRKRPTICQNFKVAFCNLLLKPALSDLPKASSYNLQFWIWNGQNHCQPRVFVERRAHNRLRKRLKVASDRSDSTHVPAGEPMPADEVQLHPNYHLLQLPNPSTGAAQASGMSWTLVKPGWPVACSQGKQARHSVPYCHSL